MFSKFKNIFKKQPVVYKQELILVIEDSPVDQRVAVAAIEHGKYRSLVAGDGKTGFELAKQHKPDLIILDYNLPDTNGPELCSLIKKHLDTKDIPVLFLTSMDTPSSVVACFDHGGDNYLSKPISPKVLLKFIEDLINEKKNA